MQSTCMDSNALLGISGIRIAFLSSLLRPFSFPDRPVASSFGHITVHWNPSPTPRNAKKGYTGGTNATRVVYTDEPEEQPGRASWLREARSAWLGKARLAWLDET
eukprot:gene16874-biopygen5926